MDTVGVCGHQKEKSVGQRSIWEWKCGSRMERPRSVVFILTSDCISRRSQWSSSNSKRTAYGEFPYSSSSSTLGCLFLAAEWRKHSEFGPSGGKEKDKLGRTPTRSTFLRSGLLALHALLERLVLRSLSPTLFQDLHRQSAHP